MRRYPHGCSDTTAGGCARVARMHAITIPEPGGPEALVWAEVPDPEPGAGEVLVEVAATAVNRADLLQRQGYYTPPPGASPYPGLECSGRIVELGAGVTAGPSATRCARCSPAAGTPSRSPSRPASCCRCRTGVALVDGRRAARGGVHGLVERLHDRRPAPRRDAAGARRRQRHRHDGDPAGAQRRRAGRRDRGRARRSCERCRELGADVLINYRERGLRRRRSGRRPTATARTSSSTTWARSTSAGTSTALAVNGRLVVIGMQGGTKAELDLGALMAKRAAVHRDVAAGAAAGGEGGDRRGGARARLAADRRRARSGRSIDRVLPMADAAEAHRVVEAGEHVGKVLLVR